MNISNKKAFTLIELLVVIAIMAILAVIAVPIYSKYEVNAAYSKVASNLKVAEVWAESIVVDDEKFPDGTCDASGYSGTGSVKCLYDPDNDTISVNSAGGLKIDIPMKVTFKRDVTNVSCGEIVISCPKNNCNGLKNHDNSGDATLCINTCQSVSKINEDTNIHGIINGGCP